MISNKALQELKEVFLREKGYVPNEKELVLCAVNLLTLFNIVNRPIKKEWVQKHDQKHTGNRTESG